MKLRIKKAPEMVTKAFKLPKAILKKVEGCCDKRNEMDLAIIKYTFSDFMREASVEKLQRESK